MENDKCPVGECQSFKELEKIVQGHDKSLADGKVQFAVINTKLNIVMGIMASIGVALCGVVVKMVMG